MTTKEAIINQLQATEAELTNQIAEFTEALAYVRQCLTVVKIQSFVQAIEDQYEREHNIEPPKTSTCKHCGKPFAPAKRSKGFQVFCSKECNNLFHRAKYKAEKEKPKIDVDAKLAEIKTTCPPPKPRPDIQREL